MNRIFFSFFTPSVLAILFLLPVNVVFARAFNNDFETGDLTDWEKEGIAFDFQPTWGDNPHGVTTQQHVTVINLHNIKEIGGSDCLKSILEKKKLKHLE